MSTDGLKLVFVFDKKKYRKQKNPIPSLSFACPTIKRKPISLDGKFCRSFLQYLYHHFDIDIFRHNDYRYNEIAKNPLDFETLERNLHKGHYETKEQFKRDLDLVWSNYALYTNRPDYCARIHGEIEALWQAHTLSFEDQRAFVDEMNRMRSIANREFNVNFPTNEIFKSPTRPALRPMEFRERKRDRPKPERKPVEVKEPEPEQEQEDTEIDSEQRMEIAMYINQLPRPLLQRVIDILERSGYLKMEDIMRGQTVEIPFSKIDDRTLLRLQAEVKKKNKDKERLREFFEQERGQSLDPKKMLEEELAKINDFSRSYSRSQMTDVGTDISEGGSSTVGSSDESSD